MRNNDGQGSGNVTNKEYHWLKRVNSRAAHPQNAYESAKFEIAFLSTFSLCRCLNPLTAVGRAFLILVHAQDQKNQRLLEREPNWLSESTKVQI